MRRTKSTTGNRVIVPLGLAMSMDMAPLLLTNDDGIHSRGIKELAQALHQKGHPIVILAPLREHSASGMKLTLRDDMAFSEHPDVEEEIRVDPSVPLRVFSLDGSPCDCVIVAIDGGLGGLTPEITPRLCISGINRGPNLSVDVLHSGTVSAAREAALYGMPSIASSLATRSHEDYSESVSATVSLVESVCEILQDPLPNLGRPDGTRAKIPEGVSNASLRDWFLSGNIFLNLNVAENWNGNFQTVSLGARWYHNATDMLEGSATGVAFEVGAAIIVDEDIAETDCKSVNEGFAAVTPLESWPGNHPLGVPREVLRASHIPGNEGLPAWL